jgi:hypothetical protein
MGNTIFIVATILVAGFCKPGFAPDKIVTDRPDQSNSPELVPNGVLQIESGVQIERLKTSNSDQTNFTYNSTLVRYAINEQFELRFNAGYFGTRNATEQSFTQKGLGPISLGLKIKLADANRFWPQAAFIGNFNIRSGSAVYMPSHTANDIALALTHEFNSRLSLTYNVGAKWNGESPEAAFTYTISFEYEIHSISLFLESYGFIPEETRVDNRIDGGMCYKLNPTLQLDVASGIGLSNNSPDYFVTSGLSIKLFK